MSTHNRVLIPSSPRVSRMRELDLQLAVAYIPGCVCLLKVVVLAGLLAVADFLERDRWYVVVCLCLWMDRHRQMASSPIMDTSGVLIAICGAHIVSRISVSSFHPPGQFFIVLSVAWGAMCVYSLACELGVLTGQRALKGLRISLVATCFFVGGVVFCGGSPEPRVVRACRALVFGALTVLWVYTVDLRAPLHRFNKTRPPTVVFLFPLIFAHAYIAGLFGVVVCSVVGYGVFWVPGQAASVGGAAAEFFPPEPLKTIHVTTSEDSMDSLHQMLKEAKARRCDTS